VPFESAAEIARVASKLRHHFSKIPRQFGQLFGPENYQRDDKDHDEMGDAQH